MTGIVKTDQIQGAGSSTVTIPSGTTLKVDGNAVGVGFPSGTSMLFQQTNAPTGWTKQTTHNDKALRIITGTVGTGGSSAFSTAFATPSVAGGTVSGSPDASSLSVSISGNIANHTLTTSQMPSHNHSRFYFGGSNPTKQVFGAGGGINTTQFATNNNTIGNTGGGGSHNHSHNLSGSMSGNIGAGNLSVGASTAAINVNYVDFIIANKD